MRKFLLPIINIVNVVLVSIVFGLANNPAFNFVAANNTKTPSQRYYHLVWQSIVVGGETKMNVLGIVGFFLFIFAVAAMLYTFIPTKHRKFVNVFAGLAAIGAGVLFLLTPMGSKQIEGRAGYELNGSLIAMAVLVFIAGAFSILMAAIELAPKAKEN